ncbi:MAG: hypothetical protein WCO57_00860 [Verrucomicrobiota bacterium]
MSKTKKRTRTLASKTSSNGITIRPLVDKQGYTSYLVQGWKENDKWQRRQFKDRAKAETFASTKRVAMENKGRAQEMILSPMTQEQHDAALAAVDKLGGTYTLAEAVEFFLKHHRPPEYTIRLVDALKLYLDDKEDDLRPRTHAAIKRSIERFITATDNPWTHEVTQQQVDKFLRGIRAKDGVGKASKKTWNNSRNELGGFFGWCADTDAASNRPFTFENPVTGVRVHKSRQVREQQSARPITTDPAKVLQMFSTLSRWKEGALVRYFALAYFAGIRPEEIQKMSEREQELVNLKTQTIIIPADISKTRDERKVKISDNLALWLKTATGPIIPTNFRRMVAKARKHFELTHDEARHSFISYHVALHRSLGDAALQSGNSESIIKKHYLILHPREDGEAFFRIVPDVKRRRAVLAPEEAASANPHLKAI